MSINRHKLIWHCINDFLRVSGWMIFRYLLETGKSPEKVALNSRLEYIARHWTKACRFPLKGFSRVVLLCALF